MLFLFRGRYRFAAQIVIGIALVAFGIADHAAAAIVLGGVLVVWGLVTAVRTRRSGPRA